MKNQQRVLPLTALLGLLLLMGAALLLPRTLPVHASASSDRKAIDPNPVGVWAVTLRSGGPEQHALALFEKENGYIETDAQPSLGVGAWKMPSRSTLESIFVQLRRDGGMLHFHVMARFLTPTHYRGQEEIVQYDADGHLIGTTRTSVDATFLPHTEPNGLL